MRVLLPIVLVAGALTACGSLTFQSRGGPRDDLGPEDFPTDLAGPDGPDAVHGGVERRETCRAEGHPPGWIAVAYTRRGEECPAADDAYEGYSGVVLERYEHRAVGTVIIVCADRRTPVGWFEERDPAGSDCPGARVSEGEPTSKRIRRVR